MSGAARVTLVCLLAAIGLPAISDGQWLHYPTEGVPRTVDGKPSAQWEHTCLVTETGVEIMTKLEE